MLYNALAIFAATLGLIVVMALSFSAWQMARLNRSRTADQDRHVRKQLRQAMIRWNLLDYIIIVIMAAGMVFLLTDLLAVMRDRNSYPPYHLGYLLSGVVFTGLGMLFSIIRLASVQKLASDSVGLVRPANEHHEEPKQADDAKDWIKDA